MKKYVHLRLEERQYIELHLSDGKSKRQVARELGRSHSTICRELERNAHPLPGVSRRLTPLERAKDRNERALKRWQRSKQRQRLKNAIVRAHVLEKLADNWSPEQIAESLGRYLPGNKITAKTIYNFVKYERPELREYLRRHGKPYRQRVAHRRSRLREPAPEKRSITLRSESANNRDDFGHWEGDTVLSRKGGKGGVLSLIERKSRERFYFLLSDLKAETVIKLLLPFFQRLPEHMRKSLTLDNGSEFAPSELYKLEFVLKNEFKVFYCHPYKAYERGSVENSNGWLRQYYPKGTDFASVCKEALQEVQRKLNQRPMKLHQWYTSADIFNAALIPDNAA